MTLYQGAYMKAIPFESAMVPAFFLEFLGAAQTGFCSTIQRLCDDSHLDLGSDREKPFCSGQEP